MLIETSLAVASLVLLGLNVKKKPEEPSEDRDIYWQRAIHY